MWVYYVVSLMDLEELIAAVKVIQSFPLKMHTAGKCMWGDRLVMALTIKAPATRPAMHPASHMHLEQYVIVKCSG